MRFMKTDKISNAELVVLQCIWDADDALPMSEILRRLQGHSAWEPSTIKTLVQRLCKKGVLRQEKRTVFYYSPLISREQYGEQATKSLIDHLYHGSAKQLVASLVDSGLSDDDLQELRDLLEAAK